MEISKAERTVEMFECGDIDLNFNVQYGIIMMGLTKMGKTTCGHYLTQESALRGELNQFEAVIYKIQAVGQKYRNAKIGYKEDQSQTQIPNFFYPSKLPKKTTLIDFPGFEDSNGCYKMVSNSYFHYRTFSKVKNVKFIIVIQFKQIKGTAQQVSKTFSSFFDGFNNILDIEKQIFDATSLLVTKVPKTTQLQIIKLRLKQLKPRGFQSVYRPIYERFVDHVTSKDKVFIFKEAVLGQPPQQNDLIMKIDENSAFWNRDDGNKGIDMSSIKISANSLIKNSLREADFLDQWKQLTSFYSQKVTETFNDLRTFLNRFVQGTFTDRSDGDPESSINFAIEIYNRRVKPKEQSNKIYKSYEGQRKKMREQLLKPEVGSTELRRGPHWIKKMRLVQLLYTISKSCDTFEQSSLFTFISLIGESILEFLKRYVELYPSVIQAQKYAYYIYRVLESSKVLYLIMDSPSTTATNDLKDFNFILSEYPQSLKDTLYVVFETPYIVQRIRFCRNLKIAETNDTGSLQEIIVFLNETIELIKNGPKIEIEDTMKEPQLKEALEEIEKKKVLIIISKIEGDLNELLKINNPSPQQLSYCLGDCLNLATELEINIEEARLNMMINQNDTILLMRVTNLIGEILIKLDQLQLAKQCFMSISNGFKVLHVYTKMNEKLERTSPSKNAKINFLIQYMKIAKKYENLDLAIRLAQEGFYLCQMISDFKKLQMFATFIKSIANDRNSLSRDTDYITQMIDECYFRPINRKFMERIKEIAKVKVETPIGSPKVKK